jgi:hypothetical protein
VESFRPKNQRNTTVITDASSRLDIENLKIQKEKQEEFTLLSKSENSSISNIKSTMYTAFISK